MSRTAFALIIRCSSVKSRLDQTFPKGIEVDEDARKAIQEDQSFVESLVSTGKLRRTKKVALNEDQQQELDLIFLR